MTSIAANGRRLDPVAVNLRSLASPAGGISTLAIDHRDAMVNAYKRVGIDDVDQATMVAAKVRVVEALGEWASSILLDTEAVASCRREGIGILVPLEAQGHEPLDGGRLNRLLDDFGPAEASALGAQACKLLLYYRADHRPTAERQLELVAGAAAACHQRGLALVVEPLAYRLDGESERDFSAAFGELVLRGVRDLAGSGADLLKVQYPGDERGCALVSEAASPLPWTLLGGKEVGGEAFLQQLCDACRAGASGFIAGRAIWGGMLAEQEGAAQEAWLAQHALPLFRRLAEITDTHARRIT